MPSRDHEMWLELLRERPALAADLLGYVRAGLVSPDSKARLESGDLSEHAPAAYHADALVTFGDDRKSLTWPAYLATARARLGCPAVLLVICPRSGVAEWARKPISLGHPGFALTPLVLGPSQIPC